MYAIIITVIATGSRKLYPVIYDTWQEATYNIERLPYSKKLNSFQVVQLT